MICNLDSKGTENVENTCTERMIRSQTGILLQRSGSALLRDRLLKLHALRIFRIVVAQCRCRAEDQLIDRQTKIICGQQRANEPIGSGQLSDGLAAHTRHFILQIRVMEAGKNAVVSP